MTATALLVLPVSAIGQYSDQPSDQQQQTSEPRQSSDERQSPPATQVSAGTLADHPDRYYGTTVTVTADVEDVYSRTVFALDEDKLLSTGEDVLVIAGDRGQAVSDDMFVTVVGHVVRFSEAEIERRIPGYQMDLTPELMTRFEGRPVILADSIRSSTGEELLSDD